MKLEPSILTCISIQSSKTKELAAMIFTSPHS